jgi:hypothetical protein
VLNVAASRVAAEVHEHSETAMKRAADSAAGGAVGLVRRSVLLAFLLLSGVELEAQGSQTEGDRGWLSGMSLGIPGIRREALAEFFTIGGHWTQFQPNRPGADFGLAFVPRGVAFAALGVVARIGVAVPLVPRAGFAVVPSAGASLLGVVAAGDAAGTIGGNWGIAAVATGEDGWGARIGVSWHQVRASNEAVWLLELGLVWGPRLR